MQSPPLHHPVPQHRVQFDAVNSPYSGASANTGVPPAHGNPAAAYGHSVQQQAYAQNPYVQAGQAPHMQPPPQSYQQQQQPGFNPLDFVGGSELGKHALNYGQRYLSASMGTYAPVAGSMRYYFQVTNEYVRQKLGIILFPWRHKPWSRQVQPVPGTSDQETFAYPSDDINAPDMYIPIMAFVSHLVVIALTQGLQGTFHPDLFGIETSKALALVILELMVLKVSTYLLAASSSSLMDLFAYSGYKFVGITLSNVVALVLPKNPWARWLVFAYTSSALAFFMLRSLRYILLPEYAPSSVAPTTISTAKRQQRIQFLFFYGVVCQMALMWLLL